MNVERVREMVEEVRRVAATGDHEDAHIHEDEVWSEVLASIALGNPDAKNLAAVALETQDIKFQRWYA